MGVSLRDAATRLLRPGGRMIPAAATISAQLVEMLPPELPEATLRALDQLRVGYHPLRLHTVAHCKLSAAASVVRYDFGALGETSNQESRVVLSAQRRGRCNAVAWWFELELGEATTLRAAPGCAVRTWKQNVSYLPEPIEVEPGTQIEVMLFNHNDDQLHCLAGLPGTVHNDLGLYVQDDRASALTP